MKLLDILNAHKANPTATKVFVSLDESRRMFGVFGGLEYIPQLAVSLGRASGLDWFEDDTLQSGTFRLE